MDEDYKSAVERGDLLPLMEAFYSIQGEGFFAGRPAYFLRIGGCDVGCHWCDVKESWDPELHPLTTVEKIIHDINKYPVDTVVITGGEPLMWNLNKLTKSLRDKGLQVHLETSGTFQKKGEFDWICLSPKKFQPAIDEIKLIANELKVIVCNKHDLQWAEEQANGVLDNCKLYVQPEWSKKQEVFPLIVDFVQRNKKWSISLQTHKYMNIP